MSGNTFGKIFKVTTFGESHGEALGCIVDGCPAGIPISIEKIQDALNRRKPGGSNPAATPRNENDKVEILSGIFEGFSTGTPIAMIIRNTSQRSSDYGEIIKKFRPGHADFTFFQKYGIRDYRGGGRSSGRETCARVAAGAIATQVLEKYTNISIIAHTLEAAGIKAEKTDFSVIEKNLIRCADMDASEKMLKKIDEYRKQGDSCGGIIECIVKNCPVGLGEPVFDKLDALLAQAMLSIGAVKGIEFGSGFQCAKMQGSSFNDNMYQKNNEINFYTNNAGGILGGISNGNDIVFKLAIKPVPSIRIEQKTVNTSGENVTISVEGRHDVCLCPRIIPVVEAMTAITLTDLLLQNSCSKKA